MREFPTRTRSSAYPLRSGTKKSSSPPGCLFRHKSNKRSDILKERLFGLGNPEGNHGESIKEIHYYLDNTPTHSYMKYLYKYPQSKFPYENIREENKNRSRDVPEYNIIDTGIFK